MLERTRQIARDAPGSNVSHSDTSKFQLSNLALGIDGKIADYQRILGYLRGLDTASHQRVQQGSLFKLYNEGTGECKFYFMLEMGGGESVKIDGNTIITLSASAPLARACAGKAREEEVELNGTTFEVQEVM